MKAIKGRGNRSTELMMRMALVRAGLSGWLMHVALLPGRPDFYFPRQRVAVFVDGCFWHGCPECGHIPRRNSEFWAAKIRSTRRRDRRHAESLNIMGVEVMRIWEHDLNRCPDTCVQLVCGILRCSSSVGER